MTFIERLKEHACRKAPLSDPAHARQCALSEKDVPRDVTRIDTGQQARIVELQGSSRVISKLKAMGIVSGIVITKKGASPMRGPIILERDGMLFAVSRDLAQKIIVLPV
jgi:Fe2+ transport system protein FeoA